MSECKYLRECPVFNNFKNEGIKNIWIKTYCRGSMYEECVRIKMTEEGKTPPDNLLPNGNTY